MEGPAAAQLSEGGPDVRRRRHGPVAVAGALASRPRLWPAAARQARALVPPGWWRRKPFLPVPDRDWLRFRMTTAYGDPSAAMDVEDLLTWLAWTDTTPHAPPTGAPDRP